MIRSNAVFAGLLFSVCGWARTYAAQTAASQSCAQVGGLRWRVWQYSLTLDGYLPAMGEAYVTPTFTADHKWLHASQLAITMKTCVPGRSG